jgi:ataxia telangiectasia mutated family protein
LEPPDVIRSYFSRAYDLVEHNKGDSEQQAGICHSFASFLDKQHDALAKSSELQRLRSYRDRKKSQLSSIQKQVKSLSRKQSAELQSVQDITAREFQADSEAVQELEKSKKTFLHQSLKMYSKALILADTFNDSVIRLVTMWLEHHADESIHEFMGSVFEDKIPSWKFVFLGPQLAARLNLLPPGVTSSFQDILNRLMLRLSQEHPYQILYQVITLAYGHNALPRKPNDASSSGRGAAAAAILAHIASSPGKSKRVPVKRVSADMQMFSTAAVKWCAVKVAEDTKYQRGGEMDLPSTCPLLSLKRLPIPVATSVVKVDPSSRYENVATLVRYSPKFKVAGGLSRPTILSCTDSDGRKHLQLVSGL